MKKLIFIFVLFINININAQSPFENWSTLNIKGKLNDKLILAIEGEQRYSYETRHVRYFHTDIGLVYKIYDKLRIGGYYRELYELKREERVMEVRPHLDFFYKFNKSFKIRVRNEYQIKEFSDNIYRFRFRPTYEYKINKTLRNVLVLNKTSQNMFSKPHRICSKSTKANDTYSRLSEVA